MGAGASNMGIGSLAPQVFANRGQSPSPGGGGKGGRGGKGGIASVPPQQRFSPLPAGYDPNVHVRSFGVIPGMMQPGTMQPTQPGTMQPGQPGAMQATQHAAQQAAYQAQQPMMSPSNPGEMRSFGVIPGMMQPQPAQPQPATPYVGAVNGTETPEQLAIMAANQSRSPQERAQAMQDELFNSRGRAQARQDELFNSQQNSFDKLNAARQAGFQVGPTPNQPPNPYAAMSTGDLQQMNEQIRMQQMQQQMQYRQGPFGSQMGMPPQMQYRQPMYPQMYGGKGGGGLYGLSSYFSPPPQQFSPRYNAFWMQ